MEIVTADGVRSQLIIESEIERLIIDRWLTSRSIEETEALYFCQIHLSNTEDQWLMIHCLIVIEKDRGDIPFVQIWKEMNEFRHSFDSFNSLDG